LDIFIRSKFGNVVTKLGAFGLKPRKVRKVSTRTKLAALAKSRATREARHTMGKRQRAKIKG
jgi:hypothetical protein